MKDLAFALLLVGFFTGCSKKPAPASIPDPRGWFTESYDNGVITVQHEGNTYKATCDISYHFNNNVYSLICWARGKQAGSGLPQRHDWRYD